MIKCFLLQSLWALIIPVFLLISCDNNTKEKELHVTALADTSDYFLLRPDVEKAFGYSHAVKIGNAPKISGVVRMDDKGNLTDSVSI